MRAGKRTAAVPVYSSIWIHCSSLVVFEEACTTSYKGLLLLTYLTGSWSPRKIWCGNKISFCLLIHVIGQKQTHLELDLLVFQILEQVEVASAQSSCLRLLGNTNFALSSKSESWSDLLICHFVWPQLSSPSVFNGLRIAQIAKPKGNYCHCLILSSGRREKWTRSEKGEENRRRGYQRIFAR